jgi:hypothetical protein
LIENWEVGARRHLAPANRVITFKGEQSRWRTMLDDAPERAFVLRAFAFLVLFADAPVHAPATVRCAARAEKIFERRPEIRR